MRSHLLPITFGFAVLLLSAPAIAGEGCGSASGQSVVQQIFDTADRDGSGSLTPAEYQAAGLERFGVTFDESDANGDGETSAAEYIELYERHHSDEERVSL